MAGYTIHLSEEENIVLSAAAVRRLMGTGSGDAALLYLALLQNHGSMDPQRLCAELHWSPEQLSAAERTLMSAGLVNTRAGAAPAPALQERTEERPDYTRADVAGQLERDNCFAQLTANLEQLLGKKLSTSDLNILLGLYDYVGLPGEVIFLLANHCTERITARYGAGRRPTLRQIEKEGYAWARMGLMDLESANRYLMNYQRRKSQTGQYMAVLHLGDRAPSPTEERYLLSWAEMGFPPETVALAYDKTILKCRELRWGYLNKILINWHAKGLHSPDDAAADRRSAPTPAAQNANSGSDLERMRKYLQEMKK